MVNLRQSGRIGIIDDENRAMNGLFKDFFRIFSHPTWGKVHG